MPSGVRCAGGGGSHCKRATRSFPGAERPFDPVLSPVQETSPVPYRDPQKQRAYERERYRRRTKRRRARGLCTRCGNRRHEPGHSQCAVCLEKRRAADRLRSRQRSAAGIMRARHPKARRAEYRRARQRAEERFGRGDCARCGRHPHELDRRLCAHCGKRQRRQDRDRYALARAEGKLYGNAEKGLMPIAFQGSA